MLLAISEGGIDMQILRPDFFDSEYLYVDENGEYKLRDDAPEDMKKQFEDYMGQLK
jgi:hypothetical protein